MRRLDLRLRLFRPTIGDDGRHDHARGPAKLLRRLLAPIVIQEVRWGATVDKVPKGFV